MLYSYSDLECKNMKNVTYKNGLIIGVIFLFIGICIMPMASSINVVKEKNNPGIINFKELDIAGTSFGRHVHKIFLIGKIHNLTIDGNKYSFESINVREFFYWRSSIRSWGFSYEHLGNCSFWFGGFSFRGILKPNFICGYFYL